MQIIGHRGARGLAPENTLASLRKAVELRVDMIEFDVRVTSDNVAVLHHDKIARLNEDSVAIAKSTYKKLQALNPDIPTLEDALKLINNRVAVYIEVKWGVNTAPVIKVLKKYRFKNIFLGSKSQKTLMDLHKALPDLPTIVIEPWSSLRANLRCRQLDTPYICMNQIGLWPFFIKAVAHSKHKLIAYTVNDPSKARRWEKYELYGIVTDYPDRFRDT